MRITDQLAEIVTQALADAEKLGQLPASGAVQVAIERPQHPEHGDYSTSVAMKLARTMRMAPMAIAERIIAALPKNEAVADVSVASPGFINFVLSDGWLVKQIDPIRREGADYGNVNIGKGKRIQVEFVSVNPTGDVHVGHTRGAVIGSGIAALLGAAGYDVQKEYYVNDAGTQMRLYVETIYARYMQAAGRNVPLPEGAYQGEGPTELAKAIFTEEGGRLANLPRDDALKNLLPIVLGKTLASIRSDLERLGVSYNNWFSEQSLLAGGVFDEALQTLEKRGYLVEREGARWFASTKLGEDKDNVVIRSGGGGPTYFGTDIAYHYDKFIHRKFDRVINVLGADHHGHVARMKAVVEALGVDPERLIIILNQMVTFKRGQDAAVKFSKRKGVMVMLRELVEEVGPDACRYIFLSRSPGSQMEFDLELATKQSLDNPVYYVQYAHARIASVLRMAKERAIEFEGGDATLLKHPLELALIRHILVLPDVIELAADRLEPHHIPRYAEDLARAFTHFYDAKDECRVISSDPADLPISRARLKLVDSARVALARCLALMGMTAPERM
ncbi:MAG: arginine--tRNA ligase [Chloroflexi bacterium]|nr:arginine--tRNA ligase [Chloroflexota bacterium]